MMNPKNVNLYLLASIMLLGSACGESHPQIRDSDTTVTSEDQDVTISGNEESKDSSSQENIGASPLPAIIQESDAEPPPAPSLCTWATSVDAIIWGTLEDVRLVDTPLIGATGIAGEWEWLQACEGQINPAMELDIRVKQILQGDVAEDVLTVHLGLEQRTLLQPMPTRGNNDELQWSNNGSGGQALVVGQPIGMAIHYLPQQQAWSLMGEALFGIDVSGMIIFQQRAGEAIDPAPQGAAGQTISQLVRQISSCTPTAESAQRRTFIKNVWGPEGQRLTSYLAAWCMQTSDTLLPGQCHADSDCEPGQNCINSSCQ